MAEPYKQVNYPHKPPELYFEAPSHAYHDQTYSQELWSLFVMEVNFDQYNHLKNLTYSCP